MEEKNGGNGLETSKATLINQKTCTIDEHSKIYTLGKPINEEFYTLFVPFGRVSKELGRKLIGETVILKDDVPIISIQPQANNGVKIKTMNVAKHELLHKKIYYQLLKFQLCRRCYKCEAICLKKAIKIEKNTYSIDKDLCSHCLSCTDTNFVAEGCLMKQFLRIKKEVS